MLVSKGRIWPAVILYWKLYGNALFLLHRNIYILVGRFYSPSFLGFSPPALCHKHKEGVEDIMHNALSVKK